VSDVPKISICVRLLRQQLWRLGLPQIQILFFNSVKASWPCLPWACGFVAVFFCFSGVFFRLKPPLIRPATAHHAVLKTKDSTQSMLFESRVPARPPTARAQKVVSIHQLFRDCVLATAARRSNNTLVSICAMLVNFKLFWIQHDYFVINHVKNR
jgi:hypothetical protein